MQGQEGTKNKASALSPIGVLAEALACNLGTITKAKMPTQILPIL
jgi:hypothetical protein